MGIWSNYYRKTLNLRLLLLDMDSITHFTNKKLAQTCRKIKALGIATHLSIAAGQALRDGDIDRYNILIKLMNDIDENRKNQY